MCKQLAHVALGSAVAGIRTHDLLIAIRHRNHSTTEPHLCGDFEQFWPDTVADVMTSLFTVHYLR